MAFVPCPYGYTPRLPGVGWLAMRVQGWGIDGQINSPSLGLIRPWEPWFWRKSLEEQGLQSLVGASGSLVAWGLAAGGLRLQVRGPGTSFLSWLRAECCTIILVGMVGAP